MGSLDYFIEIRTDSSTLNNMIQEYSRNSIYQSAFFFGKNNDDCDGMSAGFIVAIDNFLPANHLIYDFLTNYISCDLHIETNGNKRKFDFGKKRDFIKYMYDIWERKIDFAYENFGAIIINHKNYYKQRNKLYRKYYKKIIRNQNTGDGTLC